MATPEEQQAEIDEARRKSAIECGRRKIRYADAETEILRQDKKLEALALIFMLSKKYNMCENDLITFIENIPYI